MNELFVYSILDVAGFRSLRRDIDTSFCPLAHFQLCTLLFDVTPIVGRRRNHFLSYRALPVGHCSLTCYCQLIYQESSRSDIFMHSAIRRMTNR